jgi:hypothetical protein
MEIPATANDNAPTKTYIVKKKLWRTKTGTFVTVRPGGQAVTSPDRDAPVSSENVAADEHSKPVS